ncbi:MAG: hypothetical protein U0X74_01765 [Anaerolineales bacterium]
MTELNFMLQDIISTVIGFLFFPLLLIMPGYVVGWLLNVFNFRERLLHSRFAFSLVLSVSVAPILFYLTSALFSFIAVFVLVGLFVAGFLVLLFVDMPRLPSFQNRFVKWLLICMFFWFVFALFSLVDIQWGKELYYSVVGYDQVTRISIVDAMTRTGVPPVNPSYYPGYPVLLNFLYFFWYILGSIVDQLGGRLVDARGAFFASGIWSGFALLATIAVFIRLRNKNHKDNWKTALIGIGLLSVSGLDFLPASIAMRYVEGAIGDIEHWNEQITAWVGAILWVPHHIAALVAGLMAVMLAISAHGQTRKRQYVLMTLAGVSFASAIGLSVWVTFVFVLFWCVWICICFLQQKDNGIVLPLIAAGVIALLLSSKFLAGVLFSNSNDSGISDFPIIFDIRSFSFVDALTPPGILRTILRLLFLPINYFLEFGFYFLAAFIWLRMKINDIDELHQTKMEVVLFVLSFLVGTFLRSTLIINNDLGWRSWLPGQFILLVWGVDVIQLWPLKSPEKFALSLRMKITLSLLALLGIVTTLMDVGLLRFGYYLVFGHEMGERTYSARKAYTTISHTLPESIVFQYNPASIINRPAGLYGMRQSAISDRTAFGISLDTFLERTQEVGEIFDIKDQSDWKILDKLCVENFIDILVIEDQDPLWSSIRVLKLHRTPIYQDDYFAVFACGAKTSTFPP